MKYTILKVTNPEGIEVEVLFNEDNAQIPMVKENSLYQAYLKSLDEAATL
jgi:hypothetical protein